MAPLRRQSIGRSPLVNQRSQITSFFSKKNSSSPSPPPLAKQISKLNPNPKPNRSPSKSSSPTTPAHFQSRLKRPLLVIGQSPAPSPLSPTNKTFVNEVAEKRLRVYCPLDKEWNEGFVRSFDKDTGKYLIQFDDAEEKELDLGTEKIEWVEETTVRFKRLRRGVSLAFNKAVIDDEDEDAAKNVIEKHWNLRMILSAVHCAVYWAVKIIKPINLLRLETERVMLRHKHKNSLSK